MFPNTVSHRSTKQLPAENRLSQTEPGMTQTDTAAAAQEGKRERERQRGRVGGRVVFSGTGTKAAEDCFPSPPKEQRRSNRRRRGWS